MLKARIWLSLGVLVQFQIAVGINFALSSRLHFNLNDESFHFVIISAFESCELLSSSVWEKCRQRTQSQCNLESKSASFDVFVQSGFISFYLVSALVRVWLGQHQSRRFTTFLIPLRSAIKKEVKTNSTRKKLPLGITHEPSHLKIFTTSGGMESLGRFKTKL